MAMCYTKYSTFDLGDVGEGEDEKRKDDNNRKAEKEFEEIRG